jgi:rhodanese-related sulfurtransferase
VTDLRNRKEYEALHTRGSKLILMDELARRAYEIEWQKEVVFVCRTGRRCRVTTELTQTGDTHVRILRQKINECHDRGEKILKTESTLTRGFHSHAGAEDKRCPSPARSIATGTLSIDPGVSPFG